MSLEPSQFCEAPPNGESYLACVDPEDRERVQAMWSTLERGIRPARGQRRVCRVDRKRDLLGPALDPFTQKPRGLEAQEGPGNDWRCTVYWHLPGVNDATGQAIYQLDVNANGRYVADGDGPTEVNGYYVVHASYGDAPNPLWQFDGLVDLLSTTPKG